MKETCPACKKEIDYSLITLSPDPHAEGVCYDCLPDDVKKRYDEFFGKRDSSMMIGVDFAVGESFSVSRNIVIKGSE